MKNRLVRLCVVVLALTASSVIFGQTQVPNTFQSGQPARAAEVNDNFAALESAVNQNANDVAGNAADISTNAVINQDEHTQLDIRVTNLESSLPANDFPRWRVKRFNQATQQADDVLNIAYDMRNVNRFSDQTLSLVQVKLTNDAFIGTDWYPAVIGVNSILAFGYQGLEYNHTILAFEPNTNCGGTAVALILKSWNGNLQADSSRPIRWSITYDYRTGDVYRMATGGGTSPSNVNFDLLEYGYDKGFFPSSGCSVNVNLASRPDLTLDNGTTVIQLDAEIFANSPPDAGTDLILIFQ